MTSWAARSPRSASSSTRSSATPFPRPRAGRRSTTPGRTRARPIPPRGPGLPSRTRRARRIAPDRAMHHRSEHEGSRRGESAFALRWPAGIVAVDNAPGNGGKAVEVVEKNGVHGRCNREESAVARGGIRPRVVGRLRDDRSVHDVSPARDENGAHRPRRRTPRPLGGHARESTAVHTANTLMMTVTDMEEVRESTITRNGAPDPLLPPSGRPMGTIRWSEAT